MAERAAEVLTEKLCDSLCERVKLCRGVHREARNLKDDVERMQFFLRAANRSSNANDDSVQTSVKPAREAVCDSEDVLDEYELRLEVNREPGFLGFLRRTVLRIRQLKSRFRIASEIQVIRARIREIPLQQLPAVEPGLANSQAPDPRMDALFVEESELVGIDEPRSELIEMLSEEEQSLMTIAVVGMGGLGKTTLVKKVYEQAKRGEPSEFETYAWIPVSQTFQATDVLRKMIAQFYKAKREQAPPGVDAMMEVELIETILEYLENKRFLLVLDDVWSIEAWQSLKRALPYRKNRSRVILTTRNEDVAEFSSARPSDRIFDLDPLDSERAWSLFCRKAFQSEENCCPPGLQQLAQSFVKKCGGLPLAIVSLGSLLSIKPQTYNEWEMIHRSLGSELETDDHLKSMKSILLLSFNDLPDHLRSCFLFLSIFPEDYPIKRMKLIRLWIAEGLIESRPGRSLEEVADGYLNQLIRRSLVQVELKHDENVETCQLHDFVRDIIVSKYKEEGFFASSSSSSIQQDTLQLSDRIRRLSIYNEGKTSIMRFDRFTRLRSLFIFGVDGVISSFSELRLLRVLDLENVPMESFPDDFARLLHLRYLSLENTNIKKLPNSVGKLKNLETLNLKGTLVCELPAAIVKLHRLRHLLVYKYHDQDIFYPFNGTSGVKVPAGIRSLRSLQKLGCIVAESEIVTELGNLTELRRLCVIKLRREDGNAFCTSVAKMRRLQALNVISVDEDVILELQSLSSPPLTLQRLKLYGPMENLTQWIPSLHNLVALFLCWSRLKEDPLKALQSLPNLEELELTNAYDGEELCCEAGGYPKLQELRLEKLIGLKQVMVENGAMPNLAVFTVSDCKQFEKVPSWLQQLANMDYFCVSDMPETFIQSLYKEGGEEFVDCVQHIHEIEIENNA